MVLGARMPLRCCEIRVILHPNLCDEAGFCNANGFSAAYGKIDAWQRLESKSKSSQSEAGTECTEQRATFIITFLWGTRSYQMSLTTTS